MLIYKTYYPSHELETSTIKTKKLKFSIKKYQGIKLREKTIKNDLKQNKQ